VGLIGFRGGSGISLVRQLQVGLFGSQASVVVWSLGGVTLTCVNSVSDEVSDETENLPLDGAAALVGCGEGIGVWVLTLQGSVAAADKAALASSFKVPLRAMRGSVQTLLNPSGEFTGDWKVKLVRFGEVAEGVKVARASFQIVLERGSGFISGSAAGGPM
jgi:hypothetical protein